MKRTITYLVFLIASTVHGVPAGWYDPQIVVNSAEEFSAVPDPSGNLYISYSRLAEAFRQDRPQTFFIELKVTGSLNKTIKVAELSLKPYIVQFSVSPGIALNSDSIMVSWQKPSVKNIGMVFEYALISKSDLKVIKTAEIKAGGQDYFQPTIYTDQKNNFHLFYQKRVAGGKTSLSHATYQNGEFVEKGDVISDMQSVGRGAFFPSIHFNKDEVHVIYQSRQADTLTDDLFYSFSKNSGNSFTAPKQITRNQSNDFSPYLLINDKETNLIWESNQDGNWQIYVSRNFEEPERITESLSNCYQPSIGFSPVSGKIAVWLDQRVDPGQIFGLFFDRKNTPMGKEHQVTFLKNPTMSPRLIQMNQNLFLIFIAGRKIYLMEVDEETSPVLITSPSHPPDKIIPLSDITLKWKIPDEPSGVEEYAYLIDKRKDSVPDFYNLTGDSESLVTKGLSGGNYFFHLKYRDRAGNESPVYRYPFSVDSTNPVLDEVTSDTHPENAPGNTRDFRVRFSGVDDIGIKGYNYTLSTNRGAALDKFTEKSELEFPGLEDGYYYFLVQAVDKAGRTSPIVSYRINVVPEDYNDFLILNNISEGRVTEDFLDLTFQINTQEKKLSEIYLNLGKSKDDPFSKGVRLEVTETAGIFKGRVPLPQHKWGLYVLSLGLVYDNGSRSSVRNFFFEYFNELINRQIQIVKRGKQKIIRTTVDTMGLIEGIVPVIELAELDGLFKLIFSLPENYQKLIKGYTYQVSSIPSLPTGDINYINEPVYLYDLADGIYYISVKPVYNNDKDNKYSNYSYLRFEVKNEAMRRMRVFLALGGLFIFIGILSMWSKIKFFMSRYR